MADFEEPEYAKMTVGWLESRGWEVYKEVGAPGGSDRTIDIYAVQGDPNRPRRTVGVEVKTACTLRVMEQAEYWKRFTDKTAIAVPEASPSRSRSFASRICQEFGLGMMIVPEEEDEGPLSPYVNVRPQRSGRIKTPELDPAMKDREAGSAGGDRGAGFLKTQRQLREVAQELPGIRLADAIKRVDHHYKSVGSAFSSLRAADLDGLCLRRQNDGELTLYTAQTENQPNPNK